MCVYVCISLHVYMCVGSTLHTYMHEHVYSSTLCTDLVPICSYGMLVYM